MMYESLGLGCLNDDHLLNGVSNIPKKGTCKGQKVEMSIKKVKAALCPHMSKSFIDPQI